VRGEICTICCGSEREVTVDCPFDCLYLQEARKHERPEQTPAAEFPNQDIPVTEEFLSRNNALALFAASHLTQSAAQIPGLIDYDVRDALTSLIQTLRTQQSGLYYESRPNNPLAANLYAAMQTGIADFRRMETERHGMTRTRDTDVLGVLCFLQRLERIHNNGRRRGRAFLHFLQSEIPPPAQTTAPATSSLILP
jgi:hypothetical protein